MAFTAASPSLVEDFDLISKFDPAVDREVDGFSKQWDEYLDGARKVPPLKGDAKPTVWHFGHLSATARARLMDMVDECGKNEAALGAFVLCVKGVSNFANEEGEPYAISTHLDKYGVRVLDRSSMEMLARTVGLLVCEDLGASAARRVSLAKKS